MSEAVTASPAAPGRAIGLLSVRVGWRNLWRNSRRTWLTAGGIAFAVLLVVFMMALQFGQYDIMEENATSLMTGHIQLQRARYIEDSSFEDTIEEASTLVEQLASAPGVVAVAPRVEAFALASVDERSFGAQVLGIDIAAEQRTVRFVKMLAQGRQIESADEAVVGKVLARNLGAKLGDEIVVLGTGKEGGVAALVVRVVGILETGMVDLDRVLMLISLATVQSAFDLADEVHTIALRVDNLDESGRIVGALAELVPPGVRVRNWDEVLPELRQAIEIDKLGGMIMYWIVMILVVFSVVNSFIMTVFERTNEFGMLRAIGMRPWKIVVVVQWEAFFVCLLGNVIGLGLASLLIVWLANVGIYLGEAMEQFANQFYMPSRIYPAFSWQAFLTAPIVMFIGTQIAAFLPAQRIRHLRPVEALRDE